MSLLKIGGNFFLDLNFLKLNCELIYFTGSASGKTSVCERIMDELQNHRVAIVCLDSFYLPLTPEQLKFVSDYNFDHPDAWDWDLLLSYISQSYTITHTTWWCCGEWRFGFVLWCRTVKALSEGKRVEIPEYDFSTHSRKPQTHFLYGLDVVLLEGIFVFHSPELRDLIDMVLSNTFHLLFLLVSTIVILTKYNCFVTENICWHRRRYTFSSSKYHSLFLFLFELLILLESVYWSS